MDLSPISDGDVRAVARYLHLNLNRRVSEPAWAGVITADWSGIAPNHGFFLSSNGVVVGACLAIYSTRSVEGTTERICNLGALCVDPDYRVHVLRLLRAILKQQGYTFTDLSPSGNVVALNERLGFQHLDTTTALVPNVPVPRFGRGVRVVSDGDKIEASLDGVPLRIFRDHRAAAAAKHALLVAEGEQCYVMYRRTSRKRLPLFAAILYVSDREAFSRLSGGLFPHLLRHGAVATLAELRIVGAKPPRSRLLQHSRPKMFKSTRLNAESIDYLYSELTSLAW